MDLHHHLTTTSSPAREISIASIQTTVWQARCSPKFHAKTYSGTTVENLAKFYFKTGKIHRLRLINPSAEAIMHFTIDNHNMTIIANDYVPLQPYTTNVVTLGVSSESIHMMNCILKQLLRRLVKEQTS